MPNEVAAYAAEELHTLLGKLALILQQLGCWGGSRVCWTACECRPHVHVRMQFCPWKALISTYPELAGLSRSPWRAHFAEQELRAVHMRRLWC